MSVESEEGRAGVENELKIVVTLFSVAFQLGKMSSGFLRDFVPELLQHSLDAATAVTKC